MNIILQIFGSAILAIFAENLVFTGGFSSCQLIRVSKKPDQILFFGIAVTIFEILAAMIVYPIHSALGYGEAAAVLRPLIFTGVVVALYFVVAILMRQLFPYAFDALKNFLIKAAFNCVVLGVPFILSFSKTSVTFSYVIGYSVGAGIGFMIASWLVSEAVLRLSNPDMPRAFRGLPIVLIYIGILSLAFFGFAGRVLF